LKTFFDEVRKNIAGGRLTPGQVGGLDALLAATQGLDVRHRAYLLATAWHETAFTMQPIIERGSRRYFDKYEPGTRIGRDLGNTRSGDGFLYRGRGYVQITGRRNYLRASQELENDFISYPARALNPALAAKILVSGCTEGWFTGKKLSDYPDYVSMRRVVNGTDKASQIAMYAYAFERALLAQEPKVIPAVVAQLPPSFLDKLKSIFNVFKV
jgi:hypothetical protein